MEIVESRKIAVVSYSISLLACSLILITTNSFMRQRGAFSQPAEANYA